MSPADVGFRSAVGLGFLLAFLQLLFVKPGFKHAHGGGPVLVLGAAALALDDDARRFVGEADGAVGLIHVLAAGAGRPVGIDAQVLVLDLDLDLVVDDRIDPGRGERGMAPRG